MENWYIKITRQLLWSEIMLKPPEWFKIWLVILMKCNYEDNGIYKRGQLVTKYSFLAEECWVSRETVKWFISWAKATTLLTPYQLKRGVRIVVTNYDKYQSNPTPTPLPTPLAINKGRRKEEKNIDTAPTQKNSFFEEELEKVSDSQLSNSLREWWEYKKGKYSAVGWKKQISIVLKYPAQLVCDRIDEAIASGWQGMNLNTMRKDGKVIETPQPVKRVQVTTLYDQS